MQLQYQKLEHDIICTDAQLYGPNLTCFYLIESDGELALIETGPANAAPIAMALLEDLGYQPAQVKYIIPTHVHLDHAGAAAILLKHCPNAQLIAHPRGAKHLINPTRLWDSATMVYGKKLLLKTFGQIIPADQSRVIIANDNDQLKLGKRRLKLCHTPGHAAHHICIWDEQSKGWFSGDAFGVSHYKLHNDKYAFLTPSTSPVQFSPEQSAQSIELMLNHQPEYIYLTHYGCINKPELAATPLTILLDNYCSIAQQIAASDNRVDQIYDAIMNFTLDQLKQYGSPINYHEAKLNLEVDMKLNAQGLDVWLNSKDYK